MPSRVLCGCSPPPFVCRRSVVRCRAASNTASPDGPGIVVSTRKFFRDIVSDRDAADGLEQLIAQAGGNAPSTLYHLLGFDAPSEAITSAEVRANYRRVAKVLHPDVAGPSAHDLALLLNVAAEVLGDDNARRAYDATLIARRGNDDDWGSFDGRATSRWADHAADEGRAIFVDEGVCIGCRSCAQIAPGTFAIEEEYGRARVTTQWNDEVDAVGEAISTCPVSCIALVPKAELSLLEFAMRGCPRESTAIMARRRSGNMGAAPAAVSPYERAASYLSRRRDARAAAGDTAGAGRRRDQDVALEAALAAAWAALAPDVRARVSWPNHTHAPG